MRRRLLTLADAAWRAPKTFLIVMTGLAVLAASALVFLAASEDVIQRNGAATVDAARLHWVTDHRWNPLIAVARFLDSAGSVAIVALLAVGVGLWLWRRGLPVIVAATPLAALIIAEASAAVLKTTVGRARPASGLRLVAETDPSFPSGHATAAMAFGMSVAVILAVFVSRHRLSRLLALALGVLLPIVVGASRLELGVHWPTDVVAGLALGACAALVVSGLALWFVATEQGEDPAGEQSLPPLRRRVVGILGRRRTSRLLLAAA